MRITTVLPVGSSMGAPALWCSATGRKAWTPAGEGTPLSSSWELPLSVLAPRLLLAARVCACACVREGERVCCCCWSCRGGLGGSCLPAAGRRGMLRGRGYASLSLSRSLSFSQSHTHTSGFHSHTSYDVLRLPGREKEQESQAESMRETVGKREEGKWGWGGTEYIMSKTQEKCAEDKKNVIDSKMSHSAMSRATPCTLATH